MSIRSACWWDKLVKNTHSQITADQLNEKLGVGGVGAGYGLVTCFLTSPSGDSESKSENHRSSASGILQPEVLTYEVPLTQIFIEHLPLTIQWIKY